jgi:hypothetical protein
MALPHIDQTPVYLRKGVELALRTAAVAPEFRAARRLRAERGPLQANAGPQVLMLCPRNWVEHVQNQAMLAHALELRGANVVFAHCGGGLAICDRSNLYEAPPMPCGSCNRYTVSAIEAHGFPVLPLAGTTPGDGDDWPELDGLSATELGSVTYAGLPLGKLVDIPIKWFLCAADLEDEPATGMVTRSFLRSARRITDRLTRLLDEQQPDTVVMVSGLFLFESIAWEMCRSRGIDPVTYERAFLKDTLVFSRDQPAGRYDFSGAWATARRPLTAPEEQELAGYLSQRRAGAAFDQFWSFADASWPSSAGSLAVLFTNLTWDTAVIGRDRAFDNIREWIDTTISVFATRPKDRLVIRIHPSETHLPGKGTRDSLGRYIREKWERLPSNVSVIPAEDTRSSYSLMEAADVGLVYTSTTGLELALTGTPTIVAGETHYRGKGFTEDPPDSSSYVDALCRTLDDPGSAPVDSELARQYAHFFFFRSPFASPGVTEPLPGLARITVGLDDLRPGRNAELDRLCSALLDRTPFVG